MCCGSGGGGSVAYSVTYTDADGVKRVQFVADLSGYRMLRKNVAAAGGAVSVATQVPRAKMDKWLAEQAEA